MDNFNLKMEATPDATLIERLNRTHFRTFEEEQALRREAAACIAELEAENASLSDNWTKRKREAVLAEREACAKIAADWLDGSVKPSVDNIRGHIAAAIRARPAP